MGKKRIYVYAICKNEAAFASRWMASMREADGVYVLDTGSSDNTVPLLRELGAHVTQAVISPWRFDTARNRALALVPADADLCVCTDLDEVFRTGWRAAMERVLARGAIHLSYRYVWSFQPDGSEGLVYWMQKAHARSGFRWVYPVHEVLEYTGGAHTITEAAGVQLEHHPDPDKSRAQYLPLLELAAQESPNDARSAHYLGREYLYYGRWRDCERTLLRHLSLQASVWREERCASMRYLARAVAAQGREDEAFGWLLRACAEAPQLREPWVAAARQLLAQKRWSGALYFAQRALEIRAQSRTYFNEPDSWGAAPYDLAALAAYYLGIYPLALDYGKQALALAPHDARLRENLAFYRRAASPDKPAAEG